MIAAEQNDTSAVEFAAPRHQWAFAVIVGFLIWAMIVGTTYALTSASRSIGSTTFSTWIDPITMTTMICGVFPAFYLVRRSLRYRLCLNADSCWLGGKCLGRTIWYDRVRLLRLEVVKDHEDRHRLTLVTDHYAKHLIMLPTETAFEAFRGLRELCPYAPAIANDAVYPPRDSTYVAGFRAIVAADYRKRWRWALVAVILCSTLTFGLAGAAYASSIMSGSSSRGYQVPGAFVLMAFGALMQGLHWRRTANAIDRGEWNWGTGGVVLDDEDEFEAVNDDDLPEGERPGE